MRTFKRLLGTITLAVMVLMNTVLSIPVDHFVQSALSVSKASAQAVDEQPLHGRFHLDQFDGEFRYEFFHFAKVLGGATADISRIEQDVTDILAKANDLISEPVTFREQAGIAVDPEVDQVVGAPKGPGVGPSLELNGNTLARDFNPFFTANPARGDDFYILNQVTYLPNIDLAEGTTVFSGGTTFFADAGPGFDDFEVFAAGVNTRFHVGQMIVQNVRFFDADTDEEINDFQVGQNIRIDVEVENNGCAPIFDFEGAAVINNFQLADGEELNVGGDNVRLNSDLNKAQICVGTGIELNQLDGDDLEDLTTFSFEGQPVDGAQPISFSFTARAFVEGTDIEVTQFSIANAGDEAVENVLLQPSDLGNFNITTNHPDTVCTLTDDGGLVNLAIDAFVFDANDNIFRQTIGNLEPADYTLACNDIDDFEFVINPNETQTLNEGDNLEFEVVFTPLNGGTINVVMNEDADFTITGPLEGPLFNFEGNGNAVITNAPPAEYTYDSADLDGFEKIFIGDTTQTLAANDEITFETDYDPIDVNLTVTTDQDDATFQVLDENGEVVGEGDGQGPVVFPLDPGTYTVVFGDITGFITPDDVEVELIDAANPVEVNGDYVGQDLELSVYRADDTTVAQGDLITYLVEFRNSGEVDIEGVTITIDFDQENEEIVNAAGFEIQDQTEEGDGGLLVANIGTLSNDQDISVLSYTTRVRADVENGTNYEVSATIDGDVDEFDEDNNTQTITIAVDENNASREQKRVTNVTGNGISSTVVNAVEGDRLRYELTFRPDENEVGFVFSDDISDLLQYGDVVVDDEGNIIGGATLENGVLTWPAVDINACADANELDCGDSVFFEFQVFDDIDGIDGDFKLINTFGKDVTVVLLPNLVLNKTGSVNGATPTQTGSAQPGDTIRYELIATNIGLVDKEGFVFEDDLSSVLRSANIVAEQSDEGFKVENNIISFPPVIVPAGETITRSFTVQVRNPLIAGGDTTLRNVFGDVVTEFLLVDIELSKRVDNVTSGEGGLNVEANPEDDLLYTVNWRNVSTEATFEDFGPRDNISDLLEYIDLDTLVISNGGVLNEENGLITWPPADIEADTTRTETIEVTILPEDQWPENGDKILTNIVGDETNVFLLGSQDKVDLYIDKVADVTEAVTDDVITYTITFRNEGTRDATGVRIVDDFDENLIEIDEDSISEFNGVAGEIRNGTIVWNIGNLEADSGNVTLTYQATVISLTEDVDIINTVAISSNEVEIDPTDNQRTALVRGNSDPITVQISVDPTSIDNGTVTYTIVVENTTDETQSNIDVRDSTSRDDFVFSNGGTTAFVEGSTQVEFQPDVNGNVGSFEGDIDEAGGITINDLPGRRSVTITYQVDVTNAGVPDDATSIATNTARIDYRIDLRNFSDEKTADLIILGNGQTAPGSINVTTNEAQATFVITGPQNFEGSGLNATFENVQPGEYTISFGAVQNRIAPNPITFTVVSGEEVDVQGIYADSPNGSIQVILNLEQGSFSITRAGVEVLTGNGLETVFIEQEPGTYTINFNEVDEFITPASQSFEVVGGQTTIINGVYLIVNDENEFGDVRVITNRGNSVVNLVCNAAGVGQQNFTANGTNTLIQNVAVGACTATPQPTAGFITPAPQTKDVIANQETVFTFNFNVDNGNNNNNNNRGGGGGGDIGGATLQTGDVAVTIDQSVAVPGGNFRPEIQLQNGRSQDVVFKVDLTNTSGFSVENVEIGLEEVLNNSTVAANGNLAQARPSWNIGAVQAIDGAEYDAQTKTFTVNKLLSNSKKTFTYRVPVQTASSGDAVFQSKVTINDYGFKLLNREHTLKKAGIGNSANADVYTGLKIIEGPVADVSCPAGIVLDAEYLAQHPVIMRMALDRSDVVPGDIVNFRTIVDNQTGCDLNNFSLITSYGKYLDPRVEVARDNGNGELELRYAMLRRGQRLEFRFQAVVKDTYPIGEKFNVTARMGVDEIAPENLPVGIVAMNGSVAGVKAMLIRNGYLLSTLMALAIAIAAGSIGTVSYVRRRK